MIRWILLFSIAVAISNCDSNNTLAGVPCLGALNEQDRNWWEETFLQKKNKTGAAPLECGALALALQGGTSGGGAGGSGNLSPWTRFQEDGNYRGFPDVFYRNNAIYYGGLGNGSFEDANEPSANKSIIAGRYDLAGNLVWRKEILTKQGAGVNVLYRSVTLDSESSIILLFQFQDNVTNAVDGLAQVGGNQNLFIVKFNSNGDKVWSKRIGSTTGGQGIQGFSVATDSNNDVIVAGDVGYALNGAAPNGGAYAMRLDKNTGDPKNTRIIYGNEAGSNIQAYALAVDSSNNVYVSGRFSTIASDTFDAGEAGSGITTSNKNSHFLMKLNSSLANRQWAIEVQSDSDQPNQLAFDGTDLFMAFPNQTTTGSYPRVGTSDIGISKVNASNGTIAFTKTIGYTGVNFNSIPNVTINPQTNNLRFVGGTNTAFGDATVTGTFDAYILDVNKEGVEASKEFIGTAGASTFFTRVAFTPSGQSIFSGSSNRSFQGEPKTSEESAGFITTALQR